MGLFGTKNVSKGTVEEVSSMVEHLFKQRRLDPQSHMLAESEGNGWWLMEGTAKIYIFVQETQTGPTLRVTSPILYVPQEGREQFYRRLLDINGDLNNCAMAIYQDIVLVVAQRHTQGLGQEELDEIVWNVGYIADLMDDKLSIEFKAAVYR